MEKERKITAPDGCEIEKVEIVDSGVIVTFRKKERQLPKSWEEFCEMFPDLKGEFFIYANIPHREVANRIPTKKSTSRTRHRRGRSRAVPAHTAA